MPSSTRKQAARSLVLASLVILSVLAHASVASATGPPEEDVVDVPGIDGNVSVWEKSVITLRADTENADMTIDNAPWYINRGSGDVSLSRDKIGVYDKGSTVSFTFAGGDNVNLKTGDEHARVIRGRVVDDGDESVPTTRAEALDLLSGSTANENVYFDTVEGSDFGLDENGTATFTDEPSKSGHYFYFLTDAGGFTIKNSGNLYAPPSGESVTILGMEHVVVRKGTGSVENTNNGEVNPGDSVNFSAKPTEISGDTVRQGVILYDENTYNSSIFVANVSGELSEDFDPQNQSNLSSDIDEVNGVAKLDSDIEAIGLTSQSRTVDQSGGLESLLTFVSTQAGVDTPTYEDRSDGHVVLDASATGVEGSNGETNITVETLEDWSTGTYRWVYVGVGEDSSDMVTDTGTIQVNETDDGSSGGDTGGDTGGDSGGDTGGSSGGSSGGSGGAGTGGSTGGTGAPGADNETEKDAGTGGDDDDGDQTDEPEPASIEVTDASLGASEITAGDSVDVSVTLENDGEKEGTATVRIRANGSVVATEQVTVGAGETVTETVSVTFDEPGTYEISASGTSAGTLTVTGDSSPGGAEPPEDGGGLPLMTAGIVVIISGLAGALYYFRFK